MKRIFAIMLVLSLVLCLAACGRSKEVPADDAAEEAETEEVQDAASQEAAEETAGQAEEAEADPIDDAAWDVLEAMGDVESENGVLYVYITVPAELAGENVTQESLDAQAGDTYTSATLNEDGSITYKLTKGQHKAMLDGLAEQIDTSLDETAESQDNSITRIEHNSDFTEFDVYLSTDDVGLTESFTVLTFYMYGGMYAIFEGKTADNITVNFYDSNGALISTANSADMGA